MTVTSTVFPFLTAYDPSGTSEGSLDPMGLYMIADQLAIKLVPVIRERMHRIRFLTAMAVGAIVTDGLDSNPNQRDASPSLIWEWLVVEALVRTMGDDSSILNVPGTDKARRALDQLGYLDAPSYLKTPRVFGFNGVYKRLAIHLGIVDKDLRLGPNAEALVDAWARDLGLGGLEGSKEIRNRWSKAVRLSLSQKPPRTKTGGDKEIWTELAEALAPSGLKNLEKRYLYDLLHSTDNRRLGALSAIWRLQSEFDYNNFSEESLHNLLEKQEPEYAPLVHTIRVYEAFSRSLQDAFDILRAEASTLDVQGFDVRDIASEDDFITSVNGLHERFEAAHQAFGGMIMDIAIQNLFDERFRVFAEPMSGSDCAIYLCEHHKKVQREKSSEGKRAWFDSLGSHRIYIRQAYREARRPIQPGRYVHDYRGKPIREFFSDLS
jgi:hypothetical protein